MTLRYKQDKKDQIKKYILFGMLLFLIGSSFVVGFLTTIDKSDEVEHEICNTYKDNRTIKIVQPNKMIKINNETYTLDYIIQLCN